MNVVLTHGLSGSSIRRRGGLLLIGVVSPRAHFQDAARLAVHTLTGQSGRRVLSPEFGRGGAAAAFDRPQQDLVDRARIYLDRTAPDLELLLLFADNLEDLAAAVRDVVFDVTSNMVATDIVPGLLLVDATDEQQDIIAFDDRLNEAIAAMPAMVRVEASLYHCRVYGHDGTAPIHFGRPYARRQCSDDAAALAADMIGAVADLAESRMIQTVGSGRLGNRPTMTSLGSALHDFLTARSGSRWGLHSYTGSVVSTMIAELEQLAQSTGNPVVRSPSEHGLACAAMGRWILDDAPFLIIVTSGMVDEFKGTLANLRSARAKGFLVCADTSGGYWFPFQGTIHQEDDSLAVLRSRGLQTFHLDRPERLAEDLAKAFQAYEAGQGPVVLVATPAVLESTEPLDLDLRQSDAMRGAGEPAKLQESAADAILHILNQEPVRLLWQCGSLTDAEADLIHDLAVRCGAALCDSVTRPGSVSKYRNGRVVPEYLGTLGLYATSARVHDYVHSDGKPLSGDQLCMFFFKSRLAQSATPFTERTIEKRMRVVQVTHEAQHLAPLAHHPICADLESLLRYLSERLDVAPAVLEHRRRSLREVHSAPDTASTFPSLPMSPNFFFSQLNELLEQLIERDGYAYTGVFDAGRGAVSAIRNLARTGPAFSGIYGRSLMGDALMSVPAIALSADRNVLAFVGDGAAALVPDIVPSLIQQIYLEQRPFRRNLSIFRLCNGGHSIIRTYREVRRGLPADMQTTLVNRIPVDTSETYGSSLSIHQRRLSTFDSATLRAQLLQSKTVNLYSVLLDHNNDGDSIGTHSMSSWQATHLN